MAKPFYSMEEVCQRLGKKEEQVRALVRDGALREFRDAGKVFFKADDVDKLAGGGSGEVELEPVGDELPDISSAPGGTSIIGLEPLGDEEETKEGTVISSAGIGVFDDDELEIDADPMADTQVTAAAADDQVSLEGTGSGSGLLDLTREPDDTSLGAELLDEIYPGEDEVDAAAASGLGAPAQQVEEDEAEEPEPVAAAPEPEPEYAAPRVVVAGDPNEGLFGGLLVGALLLLTLAGSVVASNLQGFTPDYARFLSDNFWPFLGGAVLLPILALLVGWVIGRAGAPKRRA